MPRCPNCGQITSEDNCQWCNYPLIKRRRIGIRRKPDAARTAKAGKQELKKAEIEAKEKAKRETEEARKAAPVEKQAQKEPVKEPEYHETAQDSTRALEEARRALEAEITAWELTGAGTGETEEEIDNTTLPEVKTTRISDIEKCLTEIEHTGEDLKKGKISEEEAIRKIRNISARITG
jgi:uncharacterized membrane protein YkoI